ncbi:MAG: sigma 54-interacting transcriptional regulator [bacterium]|nr:sigma 54-interacting transcriptional regulator [bacterium]
MENKISGINTRFYILFLCLLLVFIGIFIPPIQSLNNKLYDLKLKICGNLRSDPFKIKKQIVTISVDDVKTIPQIGYPTPDLHAKMINKLKSYGVKEIFYDFILRGDIPLSLINATNEAGNVYWPVSFNLVKNKNEAFTLDKYPLPFIEIIKKNFLTINSIPESFWFSGNGSLLNDDLAKAAKGIGHISTGNEENEKNDVFRKAALLIDIDGNLFPSVNLLLACDYLQVPKDKIIVKPGHSIILPEAKYPDGKIMDLVIPINDKGEMWINYIKPWNVNEHDYLEPFWYVTVLNPEGKPEREKELSERLKDKICLVGNASSVNKDVHNVPIDTNYPGIGIHSHILYTILSGNFIREVPIFYSFVIMIILISIIGLLSVRANGIIVFLSSIIGIPIYLVLSYSLFIISGISLADLYPLMGLFIFGSVNLLGDYLIRGKEIEQLMQNLKNINNDLFRKKEILEDMQDKLLDYEAYINEEKKDFQNKVKQLEDSIKTDKNNINKLEKERNDLLEKIIKLSKKTTKPFINIYEKPAKEMRKLIDECRSFGIVTQNKQMLELFQTAKKFAMSEEPVIILGETGTGKQLFAEAIHKMSSRSDKTMIEINVPSVPETLLESEMFGHKKGAFSGAISDKKGLFELADKSTVFLDEIGDMKYDLQAKILRVLEQKTIDKVGRTDTIPIKVDIRIIAATNKNIEDEIANKRFREDLYYRLKVHTIELVPLRERKDDILLLAEYFVKISNAPGKEFNDEAKIKLNSYSWPGNVRDLRSVVLNAIALSEKAVIREEDICLPKTAGIENNISLKEHMEIFENVEDEEFLKIMRSNNFVIENTASMLNQARGTVGSRFKGICFQKLSENVWDIKSTASKLTNDPEQSELLVQRLNEYYQNVVDVIKEYQNKESATKECQRRFKNLPKKYHKYIEELIGIVLKEN